MQNLRKNENILKKFNKKEGFYRNLANSFN